MDHDGDIELASNVKFHALKVRVTPVGEIPDTGPVECDITSPGGGNGWKVEDNEIHLEKAEGPFCIQFDLDNDLDWDVDDPIWIQEDICPEGACPRPDQIWIFKNPRRELLTIMDMNVGDGCRFKYRLNFTDGRYCDPVIENGGNNVFE